MRSAQLLYTINIIIKVKLKVNSAINGYMYRLHNKIYKKSDTQVKLIVSWLHSSRHMLRSVNTPTAQEQNIQLLFRYLQFNLPDSVMDVFTINCFEAALMNFGLTKLLYGKLIFLKLIGNISLGPYQHFFSIRLFSSFGVNTDTDIEALRVNSSQPYNGN